MHEQKPNDRVNVDVNANVNVDVKSNAVMVLGVCAVLSVGFVTLGIVCIAGQPDGANKLQALVPWGRKLGASNRELPLKPPTERL